MTDETCEPLGGRIARGRWPKGRVRLAYSVLSLTILLLTEGLIVLIIRDADEQLVKFGLLQPLFAALIALAVVMGAWVAKGNFTNEQRKGVRSASSSTIAVRLWALCFVLLVGAMQLSAFLSAVQFHVVPKTGASRSPGKKIVVKSTTTLGATSASIKVVQ